MPVRLVHKKLLMESQKHEHAKLALINCPGQFYLVTP